MDSMFIAVGTIFLDFQSSGGIATVFAGGVARNAGGTLIRITAAFRAFYGDDQANAFFTSHNNRGSVNFTRNRSLLHI
jgi:hypothetical protein